MQGFWWVNTPTAVAYDPAEMGWQSPAIVVPIKRRAVVLHVVPIVALAAVIPLVVVPLSWSSVLVRPVRKIHQPQIPTIEFNIGEILEPFTPDDLSWEFTSTLPIRKIHQPQIPTVEFNIGGLLEPVTPDDMAWEFTPTLPIRKIHQPQIPTVEFNIGELLEPFTPDDLSWEFTSTLPKPLLKQPQIPTVEFNIGAIVVPYDPAEMGWQYQPTIPVRSKPKFTSIPFDPPLYETLGFIKVAFSTDVYIPGKVKTTIISVSITPPFSTLPTVTPDDLSWEFTPTLPIRHIVQPQIPTIEFNIGEILEPFTPDDLSWEFTPILPIRHIVQPQIWMWQGPDKGWLPETAPPAPTVSRRVHYTTVFEPPFPAVLPRQGKWIGPYNLATNTTTVAADQIRYVPIIIPYPTYIDRMSIYITVPADGLGEIGIYPIERGVIGDRIFRERITVNETTPIIATKIWLAPGSYAWAILTNISITVRRGIVQYPLIPQDAPSSNAVSHWTEFYTFADLPVTPGTLVTSTSGPPRVLARIG